MANIRNLEHIVKDIRDTVPKEPGDSIEAWAKKTWAMALEQYEREKPSLPRVEQALKQSKRLLAEQESKGMNE